jgi:DNA-binding NarL/FixJ family response regulator
MSHTHAGDSRWSILAAAMSKIKVVLAEDHELVRLGVRMVLARSRRYELVAETAHGRELEALVREHDAQLVLLDLVLRDSSGLELAARLKRAAPSAKILVVTGDASAAVAKEALRVGADGLVLKEGKGEELLGAMDVVIDGGRYVSPRLGGVGLASR